MHGAKTYIVKLLDQLRVLVRNMLLNESSGLEQLRARLAAELALVFLLDIRFDSFAQLPAYS